jgi:two-component system, OmpR family, phosphate regulon sensor histidine kinase PhoR
MRLSKVTPQPKSLKRLVAILILVVLLPALFYSVYEITALTQSENLIEQIYRRQLDAVLFSLNQYAWDIADNWAHGISRQLQEQAPTGRVQQGVQNYLLANKGIDALFVADSSGDITILSAYAPGEGSQGRIQSDDYLKLLQSEQPRVSRLLNFYRTGYRKIEGVRLSGVRQDPSICLLFVTTTSDSRVRMAGIVLDAESFVREALRQKLDEAGSNEFLLSVIRKSDRRQIYSTGQSPRGLERQLKDLWLFPDYALGIRLRGQTIEELVSDRFYRNVALLVVLDILLIAGVWFIYRTIRREMELAQLKADFVSNVSHELRTPLSLIRMFGETLEMGRVPTEEKKHEYYATIVRETERLTGLVNNVLNFSRIESGKKEYQLSDHDLNEIVQRVVAQYEPHMTHLGFELSKEFASTPLPCKVDQESISEALLNVLDNALKYSAEKKWIRITTGATNGTVFVQVEDHGIGIAPHEQGKIFDKFYRASASQRVPAKGSGLGLTLAQHILHAHQGTITFKSEIGVGSTFKLSVPRLP